MTPAQADQIIALINNVIVYLDFFHQAIPFISGILLAVIFASAWRK